MNIVLMAENHISALAAIERACFSEPWSENGLREELTNPNALFLAAEEGDTVLGYIGCQAVIDEGYITNVATAPEYRRKGVARALVRALTACATEKQLSFLTLEVRVSNAPAIALYEGEGFRPVGSRKSYYAAPAEDALLMTRYLSIGKENYGA